MESLNWIPSERGTVHAELTRSTSSAGDPSHISPARRPIQQAGRTLVVDPTPQTAPAGRQFTGWIDTPSSGGSVRITVTTTGPAHPQQVWHRLESVLATRTA